jgi:hypothetical protein
MRNPVRPDMKRLIPLLALLHLPASATAATADLGPHGTLSITIPKDWTIASQKEEDTGLVLVISPPADVNAKLVINVVFPLDRQPLSKEAVQEETNAAGDQYVDASVEKKKVLREFKLSSGYGAYCVFTDASMVGKPKEKDSFKMVGTGIIWFNEDVKAGVTMVADDENGPDFAALLAAVSSATVSARK